MSKTFRLSQKALVVMKMLLCLIMFVGSLIQISSGRENMNKMVSVSVPTITPKSGKLSKIILVLTRKQVEEQRNSTERRFRTSSERGKERKIRKKMSLQRRKRSIGSVKVRGFLKPKDDDDTYHSAPPSLVALVFLDIIAGLFTFNAIAALLFVANS